MFTVLIGNLISCHRKKPASGLFYWFSTSGKLIKNILQNIFSIFVARNSLFNKTQQPPAVFLNCLRNIIAAIYGHLRRYIKCIIHLFRKTNDAQLYFKRSEESYEI